MANAVVCSMNVNEPGGGQEERIREPFLLLLLDGLPTALQGRFGAIPRRAEGVPKGYSSAHGIIGAGGLWVREGAGSSDRHTQKSQDNRGLSQES
jgi:hypothetical protein